MNEPIDKAYKALKATSINTSLFLWLSTITHYQYNHGDEFFKTFKFLYKQGGIPRLYSGFVPTLINSSTNRFIDYFSHEIVSTNCLTSRVLIGGILASCMKTLLTPLDTFKIVYQNYGRKAHKMIKLNIRRKGIKYLWKGSKDNGLANFVEHITWFNTYEYLDKHLPNDNLILKSGFLGLTSSITTDVMSNHLKIIKTMKQTTNLSYNGIIKEIVKKSGVKGLFIRGLGTKLLANSLQGITFGILLNN